VSFYGKIFLDTKLSDNVSCAAMAATIDMGSKLEQR
jgi:hypothetical protein